MPRSQVVTMRCDELMSCGAEHAQALALGNGNARAYVCVLGCRCGCIVLCKQFYAHTCSDGSPKPSTPHPQPYTRG